MYAGVHCALIACHTAFVAFEPMFASTTLRARRPSRRCFDRYGLRSVTIPAFDHDGFLPPGEVFGLDVDNELVLRGHECELAEIEAALVASFPDSFTRPWMFNELRFLFDVALDLLPCIVMYVSGKFVTQADDPDEILVVLDVPGDDLTALEPKANRLLQRLFQGEYIATQHHIAVNTQIVRSYPPGHNKHAWSLDERNFARLAAGTPDKDGAGGRGYVELMACEGGWRSFAEVFGAGAA